MGCWSGFAAAVCGWDEEARARAPMLIAKIGEYADCLPRAARVALSAQLTALDHGARLYPPARGRRLADLDESTAARYVARPSQTFLRTAERSARELETLVVRGETPSIDALTGHEFCGLNHGPLAGALRIRKFVKGFESSGRGAFGFNCRAEQNAIEAGWRALPDDEQPRRFGFFAVAPVDPRVRDNAYLHALLLAYGRGRGRPRDPLRTLRDYVVRVAPGSDDILLGKAYVAAGPARLPVGFFLLERRGELLSGRGRAAS
jgi:hypothetical protein